MPTNIIIDEESGDHYTPQNMPNEKLRILVHNIIHSDEEHAEGIYDFLQIAFLGWRIEFTTSDPRIPVAFVGGMFSDMLAADPQLRIAMKHFLGGFIDKIIVTEGITKEAGEQAIANLTSDYLKKFMLNKDEGGKDDNVPD